MESERALPEGWERVKVRDVFDSWSGATPTTSNPEYWNGAIPWVSSKDVKQPHLADSQDHITLKALSETRLRLCPKGSVLVVVRSGVLRHTLPVAVADVEVTINQDLKAFYSPEQSLNEWLGVVIRARSSEILEQNRKDGTTVQSIGAGKLHQLDIDIPPLAEQRRIVTQLEALLADVERVRGRLEAVAATMQRFRQSVFEDAINGHLTEGWREKVDIDRRPSSKSKKEEPNRLLPSQWQRVELMEICAEITDGDHQPPPKADSGTPFLTISNISDGSLDFSRTMFVQNSYFDKLPLAKKPVCNDILFTVTGATYGIPVLVDVDRPFCFQRHIALIRPSRLVSPKYLWIALKSLSVYNQATEVVTGIAQPTVPLRGLRKIRIPLPPLAEQREIVHRVEVLIALADRIEGEVATARKRVEALTQAVLAKAFRGELVPTEAELARREGRDYEPAGMLLERVRAEREDGRKEPATRGRRRSGQATLPVGE